MDIDSVEVLIQDHLRNVGDTFPVKGHADVSSYSLGDREFHVKDGFDYDLLLTNTGEGILVTGILRGRARGVCDRCLEEANFDISSESEEYFRFDDGEASAAYPGDDADGEEAEYEFVSKEGKIDLTDALIAGIYGETPFVLLCKTDCKGLCPHCGANLNFEKCDCDEKAFKDPELNPFAKLKELNGLEDQED